MSLSVKPEDGEAVLFGKAVNELQRDVVVSDDEVTTTHNEESVTKTYGLSGLTLETE